MMTNCRKHLHISSLFLRSYTAHKPFSSSTNLIEIPYQNDQNSPNCSIPMSKKHENPTSNDQKSPKYSIPISKTIQNPTFLPQSYITDVLVSIKKQPLCALEYYNWAEKQPGFKGNVESFCILFHILMGIGMKMTKKEHKSLLRKLFSGLQCSNATIVIKCLINTSERFGFQVDYHVFNCFLNGFVYAYRIQDGIDCLNWMLENPKLDLREMCAYGLLLQLCKRNKFKKAEELCNKMFLRGVFFGSRTICLAMRACMEQGKVKEAEDWFVEAKERGLKLSAESYKIAIDIACKKPDSSNVVCELLKEMKEKGLVPSTWAFVSAIKVCVKEGKMKEAFIVRDEMLFCGKPMVLTVVMSLIKGYCVSGDLEGALRLFGKIPEYGLSPDEVTFAVLIEGCCRMGNVEKAIGLYDLMIEKGFQPTAHLTVLMIKGFLNSRRMEKSDEHFAKAGTVPREKNVGGEGFRLDTVTLTILMDELFKKGNVDEAFEVFDEMKIKSTVCTAFTYNTIVRNLCRLGQTSQAWNMLEKFTKEENFRPSCNTYKFLIERFIEEGDIDSALSVYTEMSKKGVSPDGVTCTMLVNGLCKNNNLDRALDLRENMVNKGLKLDVSAYEALIEGLRMKNDLENAYVVFSELLDEGLIPDRKIYNRMIAGFRGLPQLKKLCLPLHEKQKYLKENTLSSNNDVTLDKPVERKKPFAISGLLGILFKGKGSK